MGGAGYGKEGSDGGRHAGALVHKDGWDEGLGQRHGQTLQEQSPAASGRYIGDNTPFSGNTFSWDGKIDPAYDAKSVAHVERAPY